MEKISDNFPPITKEMFLENVQAELPKYIDIYEKYGYYGQNDPYMQKLVRKAITHTTKRILVEKETQKLRAVWPKL